MKNIVNILLLLVLCFAGSCEFYKSPNPEDFTEDSTKVSTLFLDQYDVAADEGQYWIPKQKMGTNYWVVVNGSSNSNSFSENSLRNHVLAESIIGLTALAVNEGTGNTMVWTSSPNSDYGEIEGQLGLTKNGEQTTWELLRYHDDIKNAIEGYVLCKMRKEESVNVATIASHVYRSVIVDEYYEDSLIAMGYEMKYDARYKTTADAWSEFKDECNNDALVLMPTLTGNLKSFAIAHRLMSVNYNKEMGSSSDGTNYTLFNEVLDWLNPLSPVLGWEQGLGEDAFVQPISKSGNMMVPSDWIHNVPLMSAGYEDNQSGLAKVTNPQFIEFDAQLHYASFFLTDGDNVQWMMNGFRNGAFSNEVNSEIRMSFGLPVANLSMMSPNQLNRIFEEQVPNNSLMEFGGGGYYYPDNFAENKNRSELLDSIAMKIGSHMRQHRVKVLGLLCKDVTSAEAKESYEAYIRNNDQLTGIVAIQYNPYAGGDGEVMWFKNSDGIDIPVVTARYALWNHGTSNWSNQGTPTYIAHKINDYSSTQDESSFSLVAVHAWSQFKDIADSDDELEENIGGNTSGSYPVLWCKNKLNSDVKVVNVEELLWQLRMKEYPDQTKDFLSKYF